jgi:hypothetical protein
MFLTEKSRTPYFALQELLVETIQTLEKDSRTELGPIKLKEIKIERICFKDNISPMIHLLGSS